MRPRPMLMMLRRGALVVAFQNEEDMVIIICLVSPVAPRLGYVQCGDVWEGLGRT